MVYLDSNATTRPTEAVVRAMLESLTDRWHNPSSIHRPGQQAKAAVELARQSVARLINCKPAEIILTSGGTEALDLAIRGALAAPGAKAAGAGGKPVLVSTPIEHEAVRGLCADLARRGLAELRLLPVTRGGFVDMGAAERVIDGAVTLVTVMWANNETGVVQPVEALGRLCRERGALFHCDATQWVGRMPTDVQTTPIDLMNISAHKFHGPKGAGALYVRRGVRVSPVIHGSQEMERRGGTENTAGIVGLGVACDEARRWLADPANRERGAALRDRFERAVLERVPDAVVNGATDPDLRLWNTANISFPRLESEALLLLLSERGVCASAGAACSSGSLEPSPILAAMGVPREVAHGAVRFSISRETTDAEIDEAIETVAGCAERLRQSMAAFAR